MIRIDGYDEDEMDRIDQSLFDDYMAQEEIEGYDNYVKKYAPKIFIEYIEKYRAAKARLKAQGRMA